MNVATTAGERIRAAREGRGWTLRQLGEATGLDFGYVGKIERGASTPTLAGYAALTQALGISLPSLFAPSVGASSHSRKPAARVPHARSAAKSGAISRGIGRKRATR